MQAAPMLPSFENKNVSLTEYSDCSNAAFYLQKSSDKHLSGVDIPNLL